MRSLLKRLTSLVSASTLLLGLLAAVPLTFSFPNSASANACNFPTLNSSLWSPVYDNSGKELIDPLNDTGNSSGNNSNQDIIGTTSSAGVQGYSAVDWYSTGTGGCFFFRIRVAESIFDDQNKIDKNIWSVAIGSASNATTGVWIGINGNTKTSFIANTAQVITKSYTYTGEGGNSTYARGTEENGAFYINFQVPTDDLIAEVTAAGFSSTRVGFFAGTTNGARFGTINRDCIGATGTCSTLNFSNVLFTDIGTNLATVTFPTILGISPTSGPIAGGTAVTISGTDLGTISQVSFGGKYATITSTSSTSVVVSAPSVTSPGPVDIYVVNYKGASATSSNAYTYTSAPTATALDASGIATTSGTMNGTVTAGWASTTVKFCYSTNSDLSGCTEVTPSNSPITGNTATPVSYTLSGLLETTDYYYKLVATNTMDSSSSPASAPYKTFRTATTPLSISTSSLSAGTVGTSGYSQQLLASGGAPSYSWSVTSGSLPGGLSMVPSGLISGTPTTTGTFTFSVQVTDAANATVTRSLSIVISASKPTVFTFDPSAIDTTAATLSGRVVVNGAATTANKFCLADSGDVNADGKLVTCRVEINGSPFTTTVETNSVNISAASGLLVSGAKYFYQAFATNSEGTTYGDVVFFTAIASATISISLPSSAVTATFGTPVVITATTSKAGSVVFKADGAVITGCTAVNTSGSDPSHTATCSWTPDAVSTSVLLTGTLDPTDPAFPTVTSSPPLSISVSAAAAGAPTITSITAGSKTLSVAFTAPTSNGGAVITNYQYTTDGTNWLAFTPARTTSPYLITALSDDGTTALTNGTIYPIQIRAVNSSGGGTSSNIVNGTPVASPPTITSISPSAGKLAEGTVVTITGTNFTGATAVTFGGTNAITFTVNSTTSISATTPEKTAGALNVVVTNDGGFGTSVNGFTYVAAPTVSAVSASTSDGSYKAASTISVTLSFTTAVTVTGTPQLTLETGTTDRIASYSSGSGTTTLTFTYTVQAGDTSADLDYVGTDSLALNGGSIADTYGQNAVLTLATPGQAGSLAANKAIVIDTTVPIITGPGSSTGSTSSASIAENTTTVHSFTANETVTWSLSGADAGKFTISIGGALAFSPAPNFEVPGSAASSNTYTVIVTGSDAAGNAYSQTVTVSVTDVDEVAPTISGISSTTSNGSYKSGGVITIIVTFSESVVVTGTPQLTLETGATDTPVDYASGSGTNTLTFTYTVTSGNTSSDLDYASTTALALNGGSIKDATGNNAILTLVSPGGTGSLGANNAIVIDTTSPTISITNGGSSNAATDDQRTITFTISESVSDFVVGDITVSGGTVGSLSGSGTSYTITFTMGSGDGNATITVGSDVFSDGAGNTNASSTTLTITRTSASAPTISAISLRPGQLQVER